MSVVNGSDLYVWMDGELIAYSTSYTLNVNMEVRPGTNKGSGLWKKVLPGMFDASGSCDGLYVFESSAARIMNAMLARNPVTLQFGVKETGTNDLDTETEHFSGDFYITSFELNASDAENATYSTSFVFSDNFGVTSESYWWVATDGNDSTGTGEYNNPWLTLGYAVTQVTTPGETINVKAGTYNIGTQVSIPAGVSIKGQGDNTILLATAALDPMFVLSSVSEATAGNQTISYLKVDGDLTAIFGFSVRRRTNVVFHNITMVDTLYSAIEFYGGAAFTTVPTTYASGNVIRNSTILNCSSRRDPGNFGAIRIGGTIGLEVHDCILTGTGRASAENGNLLYLWGATNKAFKFYNNVCTKPNTDGVEDGYAGGWNFHIESGNSSGFEVYNNTFIGGVAIDLAGGIQVKGDYDYSWYIHDNDFGLTSQIATPTAGTHPPHAIDYERTNEDVIVARNTFTNYPTAINVTLDEDTYHKLRLYFYYNIFSNCGYSDGLYAFGGIQFVGSAAATGDLCSYVYIYNNVFEADGARGMIHLQSPYNLDHFYIRNNIFTDVTSYGWLNVWNKLGDDTTDTGTYDLFWIENNILYNNVSANAIYYRSGKAITNLTGWSPQTNILAGDPLFVSTTNFHLQAGSPAINAGTNVSLPTDFDGRTVGNPPEIGAYEYV